MTKLILITNYESYLGECIISFKAPTLIPITIAIAVGQSIRCFNSKPIESNF